MVPCTPKAVGIAITIVAKIEHMISAIVVVRDTISDDTGARLKEEMHSCRSFTHLKLS
jgi:hypothetical protein